jgi:hypothetical protein
LSRPTASRSEKSSRLIGRMTMFNPWGVPALRYNPNTSALAV